LNFEDATAKALFWSETALHFLHWAQFYQSRHAWFIAGV